MMTGVEILLFCVVGFSVLVFLIVDNLDLIAQSRKSFDEADALTGSHIVESVNASCDEEEEESGGGSDVVGEIKEREAQNQVKGEEEEEMFDDDWEGIERTELEKVFGEAVVFVSHKSNADQIDGDVKLQLYGLQKVALQGPCHGSQPMALKVSARAKWNAWQKLGNMSREMAMEKYVDTLVNAVPDCEKAQGLLKLQDFLRTNVHSAD